MSKKNKSVAEELNDMRSYKSLNSSSSGNELLHFFVGMILLGAGLFLLSKRVTVHSSWYVWHLGGLNMSSGTVTIPLIIGIIWYFFNAKSIGAKLLILLSVVFLILSVIMSIRINFVTTSMFDYVLMFEMIAAGSGLLLKVLFKKRG